MEPLPPPPAPTLRAPGPGTLLAGRYRLERPLGEGSSGRVWLARDTRHRGMVWALKELDFAALSPQDRAEALRHFRREARILMRLRHPSLPRVEDRFSQDGRDYLVMERVDGPTLQRILQERREPLEERQVAAWGIEICRVLEYLHERSVVYRDLKPANVMVAVSGPVKLVDFGIARWARPARHGDTVAYGTPGYAPPEQYRGRAVTQSDLYALGATMYELLTRQDPQALGFAFPPAREFNPLISEEMERLLGECLDLDYRRRPASAAEVRQRLQALFRRRHTWLERSLRHLRHRLRKWAWRRR